MTWEYEQTSIRQRFESLTSIPLGRQLSDGFNGARKTSPTIDPADPNAAIWVRLSTAPVPGSARPLGLGTDAIRYREGLIVIQHFAPLGTGDRRLKEYVDESMRIFERQRFANIQCRDPDPPDRVGPDESREWYQVNAVIPYYICESPTAYVDEAYVEFDYVQ